MQEVYPSIWISSKAHLNTFSQSLKNTPWWGKLLGSINFSTDFPHVKSFNKKFPVIFYSSGSLVLYERALEFRASKIKSSSLFEFYNLKNDMCFELEYKDIQISRYSHPQPFIKKFNLSWIQIIIKDNPEDSILVSYGTYGIKLNETKIENDKIFELLKNKTEYLSQL